MEAFGTIYEWMLSENPRIQRQNFLPVFNAARFLKIQELVEQGWASLSSHSNFGELKAFDMYLEGKSMGDKLIMQLMLNRISKSFLNIVASKEFLDFGCDEVINFFKMNAMAVHSETEILFTAARWLFHDWENRQQYLLPVINHVRFALIHPSVLINLRTDSGSQEINEIMMNSGVDKMVKSALEYILSKYLYRGSLQTYELQERFEQNDVDERAWITDVEFNKIGKDVHFWPTDYHSFLKYLKVLRMAGADYWHEMEYVEAPSFLRSSGVLSDGVKSILLGIQQLFPN